jgi:hypothetical protein
VSREERLLCAALEAARAGACRIDEAEATIDRDYGEIVGVRQSWARTPRPRVRLVVEFEVAYLTSDPPPEERRDRLLTDGTRALPAGPVDAEFIDE